MELCPGLENDALFCKPPFDVLLKLEALYNWKRFARPLWFLHRRIWGACLAWNIDHTIVGRMAWAGGTTKALTAPETQQKTH